MRAPLKTPTSSSALVSLDQADVERDGRIVLKDISFTLYKDQNLMVLGPNGAGKSTFLALLRGDIWPRGQKTHSPRLFQAQGNWRASPLGWKEHTSLISPELEQRFRRLAGLHCAQAIASGASSSMRPLISLSREQKQNMEKIAAEFGLTGLLDQPFSSLSTGEAQKVLIARALLSDPRVIFWDEVGTGLDPRGMNQMLSLLAALGHQKVQIVAATHRPEELAPYMQQAVIRTVTRRQLCMQGIQ